MALFEYVCGECNNKEEHLFNSNDVDKIKCSECGGRSDKIMSVSNIKINGYNYLNGYSREEKHHIRGR